MINKPWIYLGSGIALFTCAVALTAHSVDSHSATEAPKSATAATGISVTPVRPRQRNWPQEIACSGSVVAWQEAIISAEVQGLRITALHTDTGDHVKRGQVLAELSRDVVEADLHRYEAALASAKAALHQARANADRARALQDTGALSAQQITDYFTTEQTAVAAVDLATAQLAAQKVTLAHTTIRAVDDGIITSRPALLGQVVAVGTELFRLQRQGKVEWQAEVDAKQISYVRPGATAVVTTNGGQRLEGTVRLVSPNLTSNTSRGNVLVSLPANLPAGSFVSGRLQVGQHAALTIPVSAVVLRDGHAYVFEIRATNKVLRRLVTLGPQHDGEVEVLDGLTPGAPVVASGGAFLADGDSVTVLKEAS